MGYLMEMESDYPPISSDQKLVFYGIFFVFLCKNKNYIYIYRKREITLCRTMICSKSTFPTYDLKISTLLT